jgi:hypothetical protein
MVAMKSTELRLGNLVMRELEVISINSLSIAVNDWGRTNNLRTQDFTPIPLTEEWLVKFGFDKKGYKDGLSIILENKLGYKNGRTYFKSWCILESQPKYAHSLQNLYFALTGQELEISE